MKAIHNPLAMSETTLYLAQLIGPISFVIGIAFALNGENILKWLKKLDKAGHSLFLQGIVESTAGLALVLVHNQWGTAPEIIISLIGWGMILEGFLALVTTRSTLRKTIRGYANAESMNIAAFAMLAVGAYLTWFGYLA